MREFINEYGMKLLALVLAIIFGRAGYEVGKLATKYLSTAIRQKVAEKSVEYVEQVFKLIHGEEKLEQALETARILLEKIGLHFDADEMRILVEAAVGAFNNGIQNGKNDSAALLEPAEPEKTPIHQTIAFTDEKETSGLLEE